MPGLSSIDGLSSGLKTTEIIDSILAVERRPAELMEARQAETTNIISAFKAFQAKLLSLNSVAVRLAQRAAFEQYKVDISDDDYLTATANGRVSEGSYDIQVLSVARNHQLASQGFSDQSVSSLGTGTITISVGTGSPRTITVDASNNSLVGIKKAINDAKAGVTATIINDGSKSNSYRLVLTADKTGSANAIKITSNLTGTNNLNFSGATFDSPETVAKNSSSTAAINLGSSATFTGQANKIYTFTVAGSGAKTVGTDVITINWTDGTNSGSIAVTQADAEVSLSGAGADGLKLMLTSGTLYGGDKFQIQSFSPVLQEASDAKISVGSTGGSGSPITVTSETNSFKDVIGGLTLDIKKATAPGESINVKADIDIDAIKKKINEFVDAYNDVNEFIKKQSSYDTESKESGVLFTEYSLQTVQSSMRSILSSRLAGIDGQYNQLYTLGIRSGPDGRLTIRDSAKLEKAIREDIDNITRVFSSSGNSSTEKIEFLSAGTKSKVGEKLDVNITQAATRGRFQGALTADPASIPLTLTSSNNRLKFSIDGLESNEIVLSEKTYTSFDELVAEIQSRIDSDSKIASRGLTVSWQSGSNGTGYLQLQSSTYGSTSKVMVIAAVPNTAVNVLGLAGGFSQNGLDVAGTINGEAATGSGQVLTGSDSNKTTAGLKLRITLAESEVVSGVEGTITLAKGVASKMNDYLGGNTVSDKGLIDRRIKGYEKQLQELKDRITDFDKRLATRREALYAKFYAMEEALSQFNAEGNYLTNQLESMNANWNFGKK